MKKKLLIAVMLFLPACQYPFLQSVYKISTPNEEATAWAVDEHHLLTNNHVCMGESVFIAEDVDGKEIIATVEKTDPEHDLCLLKTRATLRPLKLSNKSQRIGQRVMTVGNNNGQWIVITEGFTGKQEEVLGIKCRLISNTTFPGASGSPVINGSGEVVGMVFACQSQSHFGYFIEVSVIKKFLKEAGIK